MAVMTSGFLSSTLTQFLNLANVKVTSVTVKIEYIENLPERNTVGSSWVCLSLLVCVDFYYSYLILEVIFELNVTITMLIVSLKVITFIISNQYQIGNNDKYNLTATFNDKCICFPSTVAKSEIYSPNLEIFQTSM